MRKWKLLGIRLNLFDGAPNTNLTTSAGSGNDLTGEMKTFYSNRLLQLMEPELVHNQFGVKESIPKNGGKTIEWRKWDPLPVNATPLSEGVTPDGQKMNMGTVTAEIAQYGGYVTFSDLLELTAIDNVLTRAQEALASQAGRTLDTITREVLAGGTNVQYAEGQVTSRANLVGGADSGNHYLTVDAVRRAVRFLKVQHAPKINGYYVGIIHPDCSYDLMSDPKWVNVKSYSDPEDIYEGEIGRIEGVRFVETADAKVWEKAGKNGSTASSRDVYSTLILGQGAYGVVDLAGGGLEFIVKQVGSGGTADPLNQRGTAGWKATHAAKRLLEQHMLRIETTSTFNS